MTDVTQQLADALRAAEDALADSYEVVDYPANGRSQQDAALAKVRQALTAYEASRAAPAEDVVERVARAINTARYAGTDDTREAPPLADEDPRSQEYAYRLARAALSAMPRDEGLEALRELSERATRGPWRTNSMTTFGQDWPIGTVMDCGTADEKHRSLVTTDGLRGGVLGESSAETDAALIAAAVNYVRKLLAQEPRK